jgi:ribosomal protein L29
MAAIKSNELRKLSKEQAMAKIGEFEKVMLELEGEGKREKKKPLRKGIAKLKTYITELEMRQKKTKAA